MTGVYKKSFSVKIGTLQYLNKYLFKKRKYNIVERDALKIYIYIYAVENEDCKLLFWRFHGVFIAYEFVILWRGGSEM